MLNMDVTVRNVEPRRGFALVPGPEYQNVEISKFVGRIVP